MIVEARRAPQSASPRGARRSALGARRAPHASRLTPAGKSLASPLGDRDATILEPGFSNDDEGSHRLLESASKARPSSASSASPPPSFASRAPQTTRRTPRSPSKRSRSRRAVKCRRRARSFVDVHDIKFKQTEKTLVRTSASPRTPTRARARGRWATR